MTRYFYNPETEEFGGADDLEIIELPDDIDSDDIEDELRAASEVGAGVSLKVILDERV